MVIFVSGCTHLNPKNVKKMNTEKLCRVGSQYSTGDERSHEQLEYAFDELLNRGEVREKYRSTILDDKIGVGMNECEALLSWGKPVEINTSTSRYGTREQWQYGLYTKYSSPNYVYFEDGYVSNIQN